MKISGSSGVVRIEQIVGLCVAIPRVPAWNRPYPWKGTTVMSKNSLLASLLMSAGLSLTPAQQPVSAQSQQKDANQHSTPVCMALTNAKHGSLPALDLCGCHGGNCNC